MAMSALPIEQALIESIVIADRIRNANRQGWPLLPTMLALSDILSEIATNAVEREFFE